MNLGQIKDFNRYVYIACRRVLPPLELNPTTSLLSGHLHLQVPLFLHSTSTQPIQFLSILLLTIQGSLTHENLQSVPSLEMDLFFPLLFLSHRIMKKFTTKCPKHFVKLLKNLLSYFLFNFLNCEFECWVLSDFHFLKQLSEQWKFTESILSLERFFTIFH